MATKTVTDAGDLAAALRAAAPRDTILVSGKFGAVRLKGIRPEGPVTIAPAAPGAAHFERLAIIDCAGLSLSGLNFWPLSPVIQTKRGQFLLEVSPDSSGIEIHRCVFRGRADSDNHPAWTLADWKEAKIGAVLQRGAKGVIRDSAAIGVRHGFAVWGRSSEIFNNVVFGFAGDGVRVTDDNCVVIGNRITDAMQIDQNHSDGFQAFKLKGVLNGLVVKDNLLKEWSVRRDNPLRARMQGISFHGGPYANLVIRDNGVSTTAFNGMNLHKVENFEVVGNRILNADGIRTGNAPWIRVQRCTGRLVLENNEAEQFKLQREVIQKNNRAPDYSRPL